MSNSSRKRMSNNLKTSFYKTRSGRGQHFLVDHACISRILDFAGLNPEDGVIEIGAGYGALTVPLSQVVSQLVAIEWDKRLVEFLNKGFSDISDRVQVIQADIMEIDFSEILKRFSSPPLVIGNIPYYISTAIIQKLLPLGLYMRQMIFMVQKEVAERITGKPSTKAYGYLSLIVKYYTKAECILDVPPHVFNPMPEVESKVIRLEPRSKPAVNVLKESNLFRIIKSAFKHRRKTLINALKLDPFFNTINIEDVCKGIGLEKKVRAEALTLEDFARLSNAFNL